MVHSAVCARNQRKVAQTVHRYSLLMCQIAQAAQQVKGDHLCRRIPQRSIGIFGADKQGVQSQLCRLLHQLLQLLIDFFLIRLRRLLLLLEHFPGQTQLCLLNRRCKLG